MDADLFFVKAIHLWERRLLTYSATGLIKFIEGFFHKHVQLRCGARANMVKHTAGELVKLETTPKHASASFPAERAIQEAVEEQTRTIRADCQMRCGSGKAFGRTSRSGHDCCAMRSGKSGDTSKGQRDDSVQTSQS